MRWYVAVLRKYAVFSGRASRAEFWSFWLIHTLIGVSLVFATIVVEAYSFLLLFVLYRIAVALPTIGVSVRRLHDFDRSGWWFLIILFPLLGGVALLAILLTEGDSGENRFGLPVGMPEVVNDPGVLGAVCPHCGAPYDPEDYRPDTEHIYCSTCRGEIERPG